MSSSQICAGNGGWVRRVWWASSDKIDMCVKRLWFVRGAFLLAGLQRRASDRIGKGRRNSLKVCLDVIG